MTSKKHKSSSPSLLETTTRMTTKKHKSASPSLLDRVKTFKSKCEDVVREEIGQNSNIAYMSNDLPFTISDTVKYYKILRNSNERNKIKYTYAVVDKETGDVFNPTNALNGSVNRKTAKVKGNVYKDDFGAGRAGLRGMEHEPYKAPERKEPVEKKKPLSAAEKRELIEEVSEKWTPLLGKIYAHQGCWSSADVIRVKGWTHARLIVEWVKTIVHNGQHAGGSGEVDKAWLKAHPITKPIHKANYTNGDMYAIYKPPESEDPKDKTAHILLNKTHYFECNEDFSFSWCDY